MLIQASPPHRNDMCCLHASFNYVDLQLIISVCLFSRCVYCSALRGSPARYFYSTVCHHMNLTKHATRENTPEVYRVVNQRWRNGDKVSQEAKLRSEVRRPGESQLEDLGTTCDIDMASWAPLSAATCLIDPARVKRRTGLVLLAIAAQVLTARRSTVQTNASRVSPCKTKNDNRHRPRPTYPVYRNTELKIRSSAL